MANLHTAQHEFKTCPAQSLAQALILWLFSDFLRYFYFYLPLTL